jgi:hypothetical protein
MNLLDEDDTIRTRTTGYYRISMLVMLFFSLSVMLALTGSVSASQEPDIELWQPYEITLSSSETYANPYLDVQVSAQFSGPGGLEMELPGFWDGDAVWRIRFAPPVAGEWTYETSATDSGNAGLHQTGSFTAVAYTGDQAIYRHGFLQPSVNNRYVAYSDGTPFFWLGDTHWMGLSGRESLNGSNDARFNSQFKGMADIRKEQGYNVYAMSLFGGSWGDVSPQGTYNEGGPIWQAASLAASASSAVAPSGGGDHHGAKKALDGNLGTRWQAAAATYPQWLEIDLGEISSIGQLDLHFGESDTWSYIIEGSPNGIQYNTLVNRSSGASGQNFTDAVSAAARYLRVTITGALSGRPASITEFVPYGTSMQPLNNNGLFKQLNPAFWQSVDERIAYLSEQGMTAALGLDWGRNLEAANEADYMRLARYVVARYAAYPVVWLGAGEYSTGNTASWGNVSAYIYEQDPYKRLNFLHNAVWNANNFRDEPWYQVDYLQAGHGVQKSKDYWLGHYNETPTKIMIEAEVNYENINGIPSSFTREAAWNAFIAGSAGFTYGAEGIWQATHDMKDTWQVWNLAPTPWYEAIHKPAGEQMRFLKDFFTALPWWDMTPDAARVQWQGAPTLNNKAAPYQRSTADGAVIAAYLPSHTSTYTGKAQGLESGETYQASWYNPRTGQYTAISAAFVPDGNNEWKIPPQPSASSDWALLIQRISDRAATPNADKKGGSYRSPVTVALSTTTAGAAIYYTLDGTEPNADNGLIYTSPITIQSAATLKAVTIADGLEPSPSMVYYYRFPGNLAYDRTYSSSTTFASGQEAAKAFDGNLSTNWQAGNMDRLNQWLEVDFGGTATFNQAVVSEYGNRITSFRIEYWNGSAWQTAYTGTTIGADANDRRTFNFPAVTGSKARLYIVHATLQPIIYELELYHAPTGLVAVSGHGTVSLSWNALSGASHYELWRQDAEGEPGRVVAAGNMLAYTDTGLGNKREYRYRLAAFDSFGNEMGGSASVQAVTSGAQPLSINRTYAASSVFNGSQTADKAFDGLQNTNWQAAVGQTAGQWLEVDFGEPVVFNKVIVSEFGNRTQGFEVQYWNGASWQTAYSGTTIGATVFDRRQLHFPEVTASKARLYFTAAASQPIIYAFELYEVPQGLQAAGGPKTAKLAWDAIPGAESYSVYRSMYADGAYEAVAEGLETTDFRNADLLEGATYYYKVSALIDGKETELSQPIAATTSGPFNYVYGRAYKSSSNYNSAQNAAMAFDGMTQTNWQAAVGQFANEWLEVDFGTPVTFNKAILSEFGSRTSAYRIEYWNGSSWLTAYTGTTIGSSAHTPLTVNFSPVTGSKARIYFVSGTSQPIIIEFAIYKE